MILLAKILNVSRRLNVSIIMLLHDIILVRYYREPPYLFYVLVTRNKFQFIMQVKEFRYNELT